LMTVKMIEQIPKKIVIAYVIGIIYFLPMEERQGHPMALLSSKKFVHNDSNGLAKPPNVGTHLSCRFHLRSFHMVGESPT
jgi:hypothetical protein